MKLISTKNLGLKGLSLLLAVVLWYGVVSRGSSELSIEVPLGFKNIPKQHEIVWESSKTVTLRVSGHEQRLKRIGPGSVSVYVDLSGTKAGETTHSLTTRSVRMPPNIAVVKISPAEVAVRIEEVGTRAVLVKPLFEGDPAAGLAVSSVQVDPPRVDVTGVKGFIASVQSLPTVPVDITGWAAGEREVTVAIDAVGKSYRVDPESVTVRVRVQAIQKETP